MLLPVVTLPAELDGRLLREQEHVVGSMGRVASGAQPIFHRLMFRYRPLLALDRVRMALPAELYLGVLQKPALRRRVGTVTIEAPVFSHDGQMEPVLGEHFVDHVVVASPA